jgi:hypothetical protein
VQLPSVELKKISGAGILAKEIVPKHDNFFENSCVPPVRFVELQSFMCHSSHRRLGYLWRRVETCFQIQRDFSCNRPLELANQVHSLMFSVLFGVSSLILPAASFKATCPTWVSSLFATSPEPST